MRFQQVFFQNVFNTIFQVHTAMHNLLTYLLTTPLRPLLHTHTHTLSLSLSLSLFLHTVLFQYQLLFYLRITTCFIFFMSSVYVRLHQYITEASVDLAIFGTLLLLLLMFQCNVSWQHKKGRILLTILHQHIFLTHRLGKW